jgi:ABC-type multidrug transport system ATPase subunit
MMGLKTHVYFISTYLWNYLMYLCIAVMTIIIGLILGFAFFLDNTFLSYCILFFLWGHTLIAMAWLLSIFITSARTAVVLGYAIILAFGILCTNLIRDIVLDEYTPAATLFGISVVPPLAFFRGLTYINNAIAWKGPGMRWNELQANSMGSIYGFLIIEWLVMITLAIYFELVLPIGPGAKKDPLFFLPRRFWLFKTDETKAINREKAALAGGADSVELEDMDQDKPDDVLAEEKRTLEADNLVVKSLGLHKVYTRGSKRKVAVRRLTMGIRHGECFGFLGPNGAGKSTTISMLCGYLRPTSGDATINGLSIREDMDDIHLQMGVCPQDDALWASLTGPEHLEFYGRLKNLKGKELKQEIEFWLEQVNLHSSKTKVKASSEYSGGMKRRLSVACAMIGNPSVVLMDEPTTGLDPASRIALWQVVRKFKSQCAMMLTTHSMEEAEALCDRLGIFVAGRLKTIGHASELKERYGRFYKIQMTTTKGNDAELFDLLKKLSPNARLLNSLGGTNNFEAPSADIDLATLFDTIETNKEALGISHWGVSNTTLEEVFLKVTSDEVQDEASKFANKKKTGCCLCCGSGSSAAAVSDDVDAENANAHADDGEAGFVSDPVSSMRRLAPSVNEMNIDGDDDDDDEDEYDETTSTNSSSNEDEEDAEEESEDEDSTSSGQSSSSSGQTAPSSSSQ